MTNDEFCISLGYVGYNPYTNNCTNQMPTVFKTSYGISIYDNYNDTYGAFIPHLNTNVSGSLVSIEQLIYASYLMGLTPSIEYCESVGKIYNPMTNGCVDIAPTYFKTNYGVPIYDNHNDTYTAWIAHENNYITGGLVSIEQLIYADYLMGLTPDKICTPSWKCNTPLDGFEYDGCGNIKANSLCNVPPPTPTYLKCVSNICTKVSGTGTNTCVTEDATCEEPIINEEINTQTIILLTLLGFAALGIVLKSK